MLLHSSFNIVPSSTVNKNKILGEWGPWTPTTICSKPCEGGQQSFSRVCGSTVLPCEGDANKTEACNIQRCPIGKHNHEFKLNMCTFSSKNLSTSTRYLCQIGQLLFYFYFRLVWTKFCINTLARNLLSDRRGRRHITTI